MILVGVENSHVRTGVAELFFGDLAERVPGLDGIGGRLCRSGRSRGLIARRCDVSDDFLRPIGNRLDCIPNFISLSLGVRRAVEIELAVALVGASLYPNILRRLNRVGVLVSESHCCLLI